MTSEFSEITCLQPGQTLRVAVDAGAALLVTRGCVSVVSPPSWFGETVFTARSTLDEGEAYVAEHGGWIEVSALSPAQVRGLPRAATVPPAPSRVARLVQLLVGNAA
ncbi:hypothetical protein QTH90_16740 [Variovorax sp. J2P1-59]|uniref:hypothetical protein n=1 Tax=Variovorax flavidus TaxID=3053501 RepID=UPI002576CC50|nr:hypothetical protein [Variovorax sp. J2P1-59]MDM0076055.1 hypothetical protein [Variovorax sp. J2P1-59]